jgi:hypothetical protein
VTGFVAVDSPLGWHAALGGDLRMMVRRVPSPDAKRSVQTKQLRLLLTLTTVDGESLTVPFLLADLSDKKGVSNKPGSKQYSYAGYLVQASDAVPSLIDPLGRKFEVVVLLTCEPAPTTDATPLFKAGGATKTKAHRSTTMPNNIRSKHPIDDPADRMNCTLLYQTEPKFVSYRVRYFVRQMDVLDTNSGAVGVSVSKRQLDLVEWGHNQKPTSVAHAGFVPILEDWVQASSNVAAAAQMQTD